MKILSTIKETMEVQNNDMSYACARMQELRGVFTRTLVPGPGSIDRNKKVEVIRFSYKNGNIVKWFDYDQKYMPLACTIFSH